MPLGRILKSFLLSIFLSTAFFTSCGHETISPDNGKKISNTLLESMLSSAMLDGGYRVAVMYKDAKPMEVWADERKINDKRSYPLVNAAFLSLSKNEIMELLNDENVLYIEEDHIVTTDLIYLTKQVGARELWDNYTGEMADGDKIRLAVIDTGIDPGHLDFDGRIAKNVNCYKVSSCLETPFFVDDNGHGTHVAGIVLGSGESGHLAGGDTVPIEIVGELRLPSSPSRYFFPAQFNSYPSSKNMTIDTTWYNVLSGGVSVAIQTKEEAEKSSSVFLYSDSDTILNGPGVTVGKYFTTPNWSIDATDSRLISHGFLAYTSHAPSLGKIFYSSINTVAEGWGDPHPVAAGVSHASELVSVRALGKNGSGSISDIVRALDYIASSAKDDNIIAVNLSFSISAGASSVVLNSAVSELISRGVMVVASAGNEQNKSHVASPGIEPKVLTVGSVNHKDELTSYSSVGRLSDHIKKPDVLAPGGSLITKNYIVSPRTRELSIWNRVEGLAYDSYSVKAGTSQAAPVVTGLIGLMASKRDESWTFNSDTDALFFKMIILMTAFETGKREIDESERFFSGSPMMPERAGGLKDRAEGYGRICVRGAMSAFSNASFTDSFTLGPELGDKRTVVRSIELNKNNMYTFNMSAPVPQADFDLYLFSSKPDENGEPVLLASSAFSGLGPEEIIDFIPPSTGTYYLVVKHFSGATAQSELSFSSKTLPSNPNKISNFRIDRLMGNKKIRVSWTTEQESMSSLRYGDTGGMESEVVSLVGDTNHYFEMDIDYNKYYYFRASSTSSVSTAVSPVYRVDTFLTLTRGISIEDLPISPEVGGCGSIDYRGNNGASHYKLIIHLLMLVVLLSYRVILRRSVDKGI